MQPIRAILHTSLGEITLALLPELAPRHVENFLDLARSGFYDGTLFHRVIPGFMIQGGDPLSKEARSPQVGTGSGPRRLKAEFSERSHRRGIVSMARSSDPNSASCQFFIMHADYPSLDGNYSVFGEVASGMEVVDKIVAVPRDSRDRPRANVTIHQVEVPAA